MAREEGAGTKVLHFLAQEVQCCLDLCYVEKILPLPLLEIIPQSPAYCVGLMNLKHHCVPVIDLALYMGLMREQLYSINMPILLCSDGQHQLGLLIDKVLGLDEINENEVEIHEEFSQSNSPFYGAVTLEKGISLLLNASCLFALKLIQEAQRVDINHD